MPRAPPEWVDVTPTNPAAHHMYRLTGDYNNLHVDPVVAAKLGFERPILHGMCTMGHACRAVLRTVCNNDASTFKAIKVRLAAPVIPGQTLETAMWKDPDKQDRVLFQTTAKETGKVVLSNCFMDLVPGTLLKFGSRSDGDGSSSSRL
jgi:3-hydroxyacyl-CoA dehydrogenase/3a,7a,12a-trihydroxy-5b-cholest-24-enoyl-CoA hydratase